MLTGCIDLDSQEGDAIQRLTKTPITGPDSLSLLCVDLFGFLGKL